MLARVCVEVVLSRADVAGSGPRVGAAPRHLAISKMAGCGSAMLRGLVELGRGSVEQLRGLLEALIDVRGHPAGAGL